MNQQKLLQKPKLTNRYIRRSRRLQSFDSGDSDSDVRGLDHRDVVRSISDCEEDRFEVLLDELYDERFLERRDSACRTSVSNEERGMKEDVQQMQDLHMTASSRKIFEMSFSRAKPRLFPSIAIHQHDVACEKAKAYR